MISSAARLRMWTACLCAGAAVFSACSDAPPEDEPQAEQATPHDHATHSHESPDEPSVQDPPEDEPAPDESPVQAEAVFEADVSPLRFDDVPESEQGPIRSYFEGLAERYPEYDEGLIEIEVRGAFQGRNMRASVAALAYHPEEFVDPELQQYVFQALAGAADASAAERIEVQGVSTLRFEGDVMTGYVTLYRSVVVAVLDPDSRDAELVAEALIGSD